MSARGATVTKVAGPSYIQGLGCMYQFTVLLDTSMLSGGEKLDVTDYFTKITGGWIGGNDTAADNLYLYGLVYDTGSTVTADNVLITVAQSPAGGTGVGTGPFDNASGVDLTAVGEISVFIIGTAAIQSSWA